MTDTRVGIRRWPAALALVALGASPVWSLVEHQAPQVSGTAQTPTPAAPPAGRGASPFVPPEPLDYGDHVGWTSMFDGTSLAGWNGNPAVWAVRDGAITAESTADRRIGSTHIVWAGGEPADFEMKLEVRLEGDIHSGIAYRSYADPSRAQAARPAAVPGTPPRPALPAPHVPADPRWTLYGPGFDYDYDRTMAGNVEDRGTPRREVAWRGSIVVANAGSRPRVVANIADADALKALIKPDAWNEVHIIARGHQLTHIVNGQVMTILIDNDPAYFRASGAIGLQIEQYGTGRVSFRNLWLKTLQP